jgi:8-oxo-dGTP pyrophosphatase MutT (NUDIX family)
MRKESLTQGRLMVRPEEKGTSARNILETSATAMLLSMNKSRLPRCHSVALSSLISWSRFAPYKIVLASDLIPISRRFLISSRVHNISSTSRIRIPMPSADSASRLRPALTPNPAAPESTPDIAPVIASPSSSVLLISPQNQILLLHRVRAATSFAAAHVFPGGNLDPYHDGEVPAPDDPRRHEDGEAYRLAAIRETFEESGILLAHASELEGKNEQLLQLGVEERDEGRKAIHGRQTPFSTWLSKKGGTPDTEGLIPFTRWVTPQNLKKRYTTQMYLYFLPLASGGTLQKEVMIPVPTHDGGIEHTAARFAPAGEWLEKARKGDVILFPPQFLLLYLIEPFLANPSASALSRDQLQEQRQELKDFIYAGAPPWTEKCISPTQLMRHRDGRAVLGLEKPGQELQGTMRSGEVDRVVLVKNTKDGPREVEVAWRSDVLSGEGHLREKL